MTFLPERERDEEEHHAADQRGRDRQPLHVYNAGPGRQDHCGNSRFRFGQRHSGVALRAQPEQQRRGAQHARAHRLLPCAASKPVFRRARQHAERQRAPRRGPPQQIGLPLQTVKKGEEQAGEGRGQKQRQRDCAFLYEHGSARSENPCPACPRSQCTGTPNRRSGRHSLTRAAGFEARRLRQTPEYVAVWDYNGPFPTGSRRMVAALEHARIRTDDENGLPLPGALGLLSGWY